MSCLSVDNNIVFNGEYYCEHDNGRLIHAVIKAENEVKAIAFGNKIVKEIAHNDVAQN